MNREQLTAMAEATALTRAGRLAEATALIQRALAGGDAPVRVVPGTVVVDEERLRDDAPPGGPPHPEGAPTRGRGTSATAAGEAASGAEPPRADPGVAHTPRAGVGPRCPDGGLHRLLRDGLARAAAGVRTHLPADLLANLPGRAGTAGSPGAGVSGLADLLANLPGRAGTTGTPGAGVSGLADLPGKLRDLLGAPTVPGVGRAAPGPVLPGETLHRTHRDAAGARPYTLYVPTTATGPRPLVVMLHGGTQTAADFATATRMSELGEEHGLLVAYPEQVTSANPMRYWNWFDPDHQARAGEPAILAGIVDEIAREHEVDRDRVFVAGFSAGAAMASVLGAAYPDVFAAVGVHSGLPHGCAGDVASAFAAMRGGAPARPLGRPVPVIAFHGDADPTVAVDNATRVVEQFTAGPVRGDTLVERGPGRPATRVVVRREGDVAGELWTVHGSGHAWSGGVAGGSYTDPTGPDASAEMLRFFAEHPRRV